METDIGCMSYYTQAFDNRGRKLTRRVFMFNNDFEGFNIFVYWMKVFKTENYMTEVF